jgi:hypothetical protein
MRNSNQLNEHLHSIYFLSKLLRALILICDLFSCLLLGWWSWTRPWVSFSTDLSMVMQKHESELRPFHCYVLISHYVALLFHSAIGRQIGRLSNSLRLMDPKPSVQLNSSSSCSANSKTDLNFMPSLATLLPVFVLFRILLRNQRPSLNYKWQNKLDSGLINEAKS